MVAWGRGLAETAGITASGLTAGAAADGGATGEEEAAFPAGLIGEGAEGGATIPGGRRDAGALGMAAPGGLKGPGEAGTLEGLGTFGVPVTTGFSTAMGFGGSFNGGSLTGSPVGAAAEGGVGVSEEESLTGIWRLDRYTKRLSKGCQSRAPVINS